MSKCQDKGTVLRMCPFCSDHVSIESMEDVGPNWMCANCGESGIEWQARHDVAGQIAQESGDHASAAWARKQQLARSKAILAAASNDLYQSLKEGDPHE